MPDESDERDVPEDVDDVDVSDASDAPDAQRAGTDSDRSDDDTDSTRSDDADSTPDDEADDSKADDSTDEDEPDSPTDDEAESTPDDETDDSDFDDEDSGGLERVNDDEDSGGLQKVDSEVEPEVRGGEHPRRELPDDEEGPSVPNRGVEAGFDRPEDRPEDAPEDASAAGPGPGPRPHPDRTDGRGGGSDVPVGHAAGAPKPGEATPAGAGAGGGGGGGGTGTAGGFDPDEDGMFEGPPDDEEMPLADHIEEMVLRLAAIVTVGAIATALMFLYSDRLVQLMWNGVIPGGSRPHLYGPLEFVLTKIKVASLAGILIALPVLVYQSYLFMRPGLYPKERKYYLAAVPTSLVLAAVGMSFAYFAVLPGLFQYFDYYTKGSAIVAYGLAPTFNLIVALIGLLAVVFQIPLFVMLAIMMGVTTREWLEQRRLLFWGAFAGIAFLFAPDPTGMAPFIIAVTMIVLFEGTLLLLRWTGR